MRRKSILIALAVSLAVSMASGCKPSNDSSGSDSTGGKYGTVNSGKPITIRLDLNNYIPSVNEVATEQSPTVFRSMQRIADEFMKIYPNVKIEWDRSKISVGNWSQWMTTQVAAGTAPDVCMLHGAEYADRGWYIRLNEELEEANAFQKGNNRWKDMFPAYLWDSTMTTDVTGNIVAVPYVLYPGTSTAYYYNKDIFKKVGVSVPKTWDDLIKISKKINDAGYVAIGPWSSNKTINVNLWDIQFSMGPVFSYSLKEKWDYDKDGKMSAAELLRAEYEGVFNASSNPVVMDLYKQIKIKYTDVLQEGAETTDYEQMWTNGKVAMMEDGLWRLPAERANTVRKFEFGMFTPPVANSSTADYIEDIKYSDGPYQPPIAESYNIVKSTVEKKGGGAKEACIRFLQYITAVDNQNQVVLDKHGESIGAVIGTQIPPELNEWFQNKFPILPKASFPVGPTVSSQSKMSRQLEMWVKGMITDKEFQENYDKELKKGVDEQIKAFNINTGDWKK